MADNEFDLDWDADQDGTEPEIDHPDGAIRLSPMMRFGVGVAALAGLAVVGYVGAVDVPNVMHGSQQVVPIIDTTCCKPPGS